MWNCTCGATNSDQQDTCGTCRRGREGNVAGSAAVGTGGVQAMRGPAPRPSSGAEQRTPGGRERPYRALRILARLYSILAPLVLGLMLLIGLVGLARQATLAENLGSSMGLFVLGGMYYLLMKSVAQAIYILFDIAGNARRLREVVDMRLARAGQPMVPASD